MTADGGIFSTRVDLVRNFSKLYWMQVQVLYLL